MLLIKRPADIITSIYRGKDISMLYPRVMGHERVNANARMNMAIRNQTINLAKALMQPDLRTRIEGSYEIKNNQRGIISLSLVGFAEFGGAHPMTMVKSLTMDTATGENYALHQLFREDGQYRKIINAEISGQIKERDIPLIDSFKGISPGQDYYVSDQVLVVYYQLYELSPYAAGFPYFPIPIYMLSDEIPEKSPLSRLNHFI
ncbi:MAG: DUF3298 and DUF4163 domain-containing protein [Clostridiaceae bacterium]|nr:DUF3298 and DUF4163 domain-containing protein [Clostridiaceae bacterium]